MRKYGVARKFENLAVLEIEGPVPNIFEQTCRAIIYDDHISSLHGVDYKFLV